jgi:hypothetical protein
MKTPRIPPEPNIVWGFGSAVSALGPISRCPVCGAAVADVVIVDMPEYALDASLVFETDTGYELSEDGRAVCGPHRCRAAAGDGHVRATA